MKRRLIITLIACFIPSFAMALGLGALSVQSALHEPLHASIPIQAQGSVPVSDIKVHIAPVQVSDIISLEQSRLLSTLQFALKADQNAQLTLLITTKKSIEEPFLRLPIVLSWSEGELLREYTLFFDPPPLSMPATITSKQTQAETKPALSKTNSNSVGSVEGDQFGQTKENDRLWQIAKKYHQASPAASIQQWAVAIFLHNPNAFTKDDMNQLKRGVSLNIPSLDQVGAYSNAMAHDMLANATPIPGKKV